MRALVQRVTRARVHVGAEPVASIGPGLLVLLGVGRGDGAEEAERLSRRVLALRVFPEGARSMHRSVGDAGGELLCVPQFTLYADMRGNRPSFTGAAPPEEAEPLYDQVRRRLGAQGGRFGAHMAVELVNDGPVTVLLESEPPRGGATGGYTRLR